VRALTPSEAAERVVLKAEDVLADLRNREQRLRIAMRSRLDLARARLDALGQRPVFLRPLDRLHDLSRRLDELGLRARRSITQQHETTQQRLRGLAGLLESLSPLSVLERGYTVTMLGPTGRPIRDASELSVGQQMTTRFSRGWVASRVEQVEPDVGPHCTDRSQGESE
ncbi:MAG: exodeoxyribonuclease VII large subunit, partial [Pirellulales bacterium]